MPPEATSASSGRAAALARRQALSAGKSALPPATERVRSGERTATLSPAAPGGQAHLQPAAAVPQEAQLHMGGSATATHAPAPIGLLSSSGRQAALARRLALSAGKAALPPATERVRSGQRGARPAGSPPPDSAAATAMATTALAVPGSGNPTGATLPRAGELHYAPKVANSATQGGQRVTGLRIGRGNQVTGDEPGATQPISGTQYIGGETGIGSRPVAPKVGLARTEGGALVSGTLVRSKVAVTGDEAGAAITITGERDQRLEDDLTPRTNFGTATTAQFQRQADPHGQSVFGTNLGRSMRSAGSRDRRRAPAIESTDTGLAITGSALGRSVRVTGDEPGACRQVTGDQYLSPASAQSECGGRGGGTAAGAHLGGGRRDPVTGAKVSQALTWRRQPVSGANVEHDERVTGDAPGSCSTITGTPYQGPLTVHGWCEPGAVAAADQRLAGSAAAGAAVTGDTPRLDRHVTGIDRGATRSISGTPYFRARESEPTQEGTSIAAIDARFTVHSPQRSAQLRAGAADTAAAAGGTATAAPSAAERITGTFAAGHNKITGNLEFQFRPRVATDASAAPAHARLTGEGRSSGQRITGSAWSEQANITGTEGYIAAERNASERAGKPQAFSGARRFKVEPKHAEPRQLVTGMVGWSPRQGARVTLSGGAQG